MDNLLATLTKMFEVHDLRFWATVVWAALFLFFAFVSKSFLFGIVSLGGLGFSLYLLWRRVQSNT